MTEFSAVRRRIGCDEQGKPLQGQLDNDRRFHMRFRTRDDDIDELGHVNNAVWVTWVQDASVAHWLMAARPEDRDRFAAVVVRHEIDYRGNVRNGEEICAVTWIDGAPRGVRYGRRVEFRDSNDRILVTALSQWVVIERATGKLARISPEMANPFLCQDAEQKENE